MVMMQTFRRGVSSRSISNHRWCLNSILTSKHEVVVHPDCWIFGCLWLRSNVGIAHIHVPISQKFPVAWMMQIHVPPHLPHSFSQRGHCPSPICSNDDRCATSTDSTQFVLKTTTPTRFPSAVGPCRVRFKGYHPFGLAGTAHASSHR